MKKSVKKFVSRAFIKTVDLELLKRLIDRFDAAASLRWDELPENEKERRDAIYELFRSADEIFPRELLDALHRIMTLSTPTGARLLHERAEAAGVQLIPSDELEGENDGRHLTPRHIALRAFLDHRDIFDQTRKVAAFFFGSKILEFQGAAGVASRHESEAAQKAFGDAASAYFSNRYKGRLCKIRWYQEGEEVRIMVSHGHDAMIELVDEAGEEKVHTWRGVSEDSIRYHAPSGWAGVMAKTLGDQRQLAALFAEHMLGDADFFKKRENEQFYTLRPVQEQGGDFSFKYKWDDRVQDVKIRQIVVDDGEYVLDGRRYRSPWVHTCRDNQNAIVQLLEIAPDFDLSEVRIVSMKLVFQFIIDGEDFPVTVAITPPHTATISDRTLEDAIMEHLTRNGIRLPRQADTTAIAAE